MTGVLEGLRPKAKSKILLGPSLALGQTISGPFFAEAFSPLQERAQRFLKLA